MPLSREEFVKRWKLASLSERASAQSHFIDLCEMLGEPHPAADTVGERYTFEKHVARTSGGKGFADVWLRDHFAWEYKQKDEASPALPGNYPTSTTSLCCLTGMLLEEAKDACSSDGRPVEIQWGGCNALLAAAE